MTNTRINEAGEALIGDKGRIKCLDHGFVELVDYMGNDAAIEAAARVSYVTEIEENRTEVQRTGLIRYLMRNRHTSPTEMCSIKFRVACPIFVWRQWIRHRTASVNELSGRYATLPDLCYTPDVERMQRQASDNHQGSSDDLVDEAWWHQDGISREQTNARRSYEMRLKSGMASELARINVPVSQYTVAFWKMDLHNLLHFLLLRMDSHSQYEIRVFAEAIASMVEKMFPITWDAFMDYRAGAMTLSIQEQRLISTMLQGVTSQQAAAWAGGLLGASREAKEFLAKFEILIDKHDHEIRGDE
jgi:thymidylate synthase (FAD)